MGIRGLKTFIEDNDDLLIKNYELHDTTVIVDACNLISRLICHSEKQECNKLLTDNMVKFESLVTNLFKSFRICNVKPVLVFDGDKARSENSSKMHTKHLQAIKRFQGLMLSSKRNNNFLLCSAAVNAFKSVAIKEGYEIVQCIYEADSNVARLSHKFECPVMSNDSDFYLIDLPYGLISIDLMEQQQQSKRSLAQREISFVQTSSSAGSYFYINCCFFHQDHFTTYFPDLDKKNLPLLAVLCGNDLIHPKVFEKICLQLPSRAIADSLDLTVKQMRKITNRQHIKIIKILYYLCGRNLEQAINDLCSHVSKNKRSEMKKLIKKHLSVYEIPPEYKCAKILTDNQNLSDLCDKFESQHL